MALVGCAVGDPQTSPAWNTCKGGATGAEALQRKVSACTGLIDAGGKPDDLAQALTSRAGGYRALGQYDQAIADDTRAIGLDPGDSDAVSARGLDHFSQGRFDLALADFNQALRLDPDNAQALNGRAYVERHSNDDEGAIRDEGRAIELEPNWAGPWLGRGLAYLDKGWFDMALADFRDALRINHSLTDALDGVGLAQLRKGDKPNAVTAYLAASTIDLDRRNYNGAIAEADKAVAIAPQDPQALNARCWTGAVADTELDIAEADCLRSLAVKPAAGDVLDSLAFVRFRQGRLDEALKGFDAALVQNPKQTESLYMRGIVKLRLGDQEGGQADLRTAQSQDATVGPRYAAWGVTPDSESQ